MEQITGQIQFANIAATLGGRMISIDKATRAEAAQQAAEMIANLPKFIRNSPDSRGEIEAIETLIKRVQAE